MIKSYWYAKELSISIGFFDEKRRLDEMLQGFFNYDNPVWRFAGRLGDMFILNILWILCCIPIFTIGASTTALYYCTLKIVKNEDYGNIRMFFHSFKQNFVQATIIWLIMLSLGMILVFDFYFFGNIMTGADSIRFVLRALTGAILLIWLFVLLYVFPLLSRFDNSIKHTLSNAAFMSLRFIGSTLAMLVSDAAILVLGYMALFYIPWVTAVLFFLGFPVIAWVNSTMLDHIFEKFMPKREERSDEIRPILEDVNVDGTVKANASETEKALRSLRGEGESDKA